MHFEQRNETSQHPVLSPQSKLHQPVLSPLHFGNGWCPVNTDTVEFVKNTNMFKIRQVILNSQNNYQVEAFRTKTHFTCKLSCRIILIKIGGQAIFQVTSTKYCCSMNTKSNLLLLKRQVNRLKSELIINYIHNNGMASSRQLSIAWQPCVCE